jgi:hypothetical protein
VLVARTFSLPRVRVHRPAAALGEEGTVLFIQFISTYKQTLLVPVA